MRNYTLEHSVKLHPDDLKTTLFCFNHLRVAQNNCCLNANSAIIYTVIANVSNSFNYHIHHNICIMTLLSV